MNTTGFTPLWPRTFDNLSRPLLGGSSHTQPQTVQATFSIRSTNSLSLSCGANLVGACGPSGPDPSSDPVAGTAKMPRAGVVKLSLTFRKVLPVPGGRRHEVGFYCRVAVAGR